MLDDLDRGLEEYYQGRVEYGTPPLPKALLDRIDLLRADADRLYKDVEADA